MSARITKTQKYAIMWLHSQGQESASIAKELDVDTKSVDRILEKTTNTKGSDKIKTTSEVVGKTSSKELMIRHTSSKKNNSVAIMTKEASEVNDHARPTNTANPRNQKHIFKPNG
jgi:hypothetical protein